MSCFIEINSEVYSSVFDLVLSIANTSVEVAERSHRLKVAQVNSRGIVSKMASVINILAEDDLESVLSLQPEKLELKNLK